MNTKLKSIIEDAIDKAINDSAEENFWDGFIHPELASQMTTAAEQVFDSAMKAQEFYEEQG